jgi:hypothetical protein
MGKGWTLLGVVVLGLLLLLAAGPGLAQEEEEGKDAQPEVRIKAVVSSAFSYQGVLQEGDELVNGSRNFIFRLYSDDACTWQVGADILKPGVTVTDGLFEVQVQVDQGDFHGQRLWLAVDVDGAVIACQEIQPVPYALSLRPGAVISGTGTMLSAYSGDRYALWGETASTTDYHTAVRGKATGTTGKVYGVIGTSASDSGIGVLGQATATSGVTYGLYGQTYSESDQARGAYGLASGTSGLTYGVRGDSHSTSGRGVQGRAVATTGETYGVYGISDSADGGAGGYFSGYTGIVGLGSGSYGYGGYFESALNAGLRVESAGGAGLYVVSAGGTGVRVSSAGGTGVRVSSAGGYGVYVGSAGTGGVSVYSAGHDGFDVTYAGQNGVRVHDAEWHGFGVEYAGWNGVYVGWAGDDGVHVNGAEGRGVYAHTTDANSWGVYTPDRIYGSNITTNGGWTIVAQNDDSGELEEGELVAVSGMAAPLDGGNTPVPLVQRANQAKASAVVGVVYRRLVVEEHSVEVEREGDADRRAEIHVKSAGGAIAPGDYLLVVVQGPAQVKASAAEGSIQPGDLLATGARDGHATNAEPLQVGGAEFYAPGTIIGKAMQALEATQASGLIWVWFSLQ